MKNKKKPILIGGAATAAVLLAALLCAVLIPSKAPQIPKTESESSSTANVSDISVEEPEKPDDTESTVSDVPAGKIPNGAEVLTPEEKTESSQTEQTGKKPDEPAKLVTPQPLPEESEGGSGVVIGGEQPQPYHCGVEGHHCSGPETHAYVLNLELEGCPYCKSHNCASFYATDEWGNTCYTPSKCPRYDIKKDPVYYCQECGKKCGDGADGTCVQFVNADHCPNCGQWVEAWKCHTCK